MESDFRRGPKISSGGFVLFLLPLCQVVTVSCFIFCFPVVVWCEPLSAWVYLSVCGQVREFVLSGSRIGVDRSWLSFLILC